MKVASINAKDFVRGSGADLEQVKADIATVDSKVDALDTKMDTWSENVNTWGQGIESRVSQNEIDIKNLQASQPTS